MTERHGPRVRLAPEPAPDDASRSLEGWGFLVRPDLPDGPGQAVLLVALRERPELTHYDPEAVEFWVTSAGRGRRERLTHTTHLPLDRSFSWGTIRLADRLAVANEFVTFGGRVSVARIDTAAIAVFASPVPILRRGGHSQGWDAAAEEVAAFFGRMKVAVDYSPGFEDRLSRVRPEARYAAFLTDLVERYRVAPALRETREEVWRLLRADLARLERETPGDVRSGRALLATIRRSEQPEAGRRAG